MSSRVAVPGKSRRAAGMWMLAAIAACVKCVPGSEIPFVSKSNEDKATLDVIGVVQDKANKRAVDQRLGFFGGDGYRVTLGKAGSDFDTR